MTPEQIMALDFTFGKIMFFALFVVYSEQTVTHRLSSRFV